MSTSPSALCDQTDPFASLNPFCNGTLTGGQQSGAASPGGGPNPSAPSSPLDPNSAAGILSGLGNLFSGVGAGVSAGLKAANTPTFQYPYLTSTGVNTSVSSLGSLFSSPIILIGIALVAFLLLRKRE